MMTLYLNPNELTDIAKIPFTAHPVNGRVVLITTLDADQFDQLVSICADNEDLEENGDAEPSSVAARSSGA
jgi:hypothetical protein